MFSLTSKKLRVGIWACLAVVAAGLFFVPKRPPYSGHY